MPNNDVKVLGASMPTDVPQKATEDVAVTPTNKNNKEIQMADIITGTTTGFVNNMPDSTLNSVDSARRELQDVKGFTGDVVKDTRYDIINALGKMQINHDDRFFALGRDLAEIKLAAAQNRDAIMAAGDRTTQAVQVAVLQNTIEGQKNTQYLSDRTGAEGEKTRALINELKYADLNRALIERNSELVEERWGRRHWHDLANQNQFAAVNSQLQAFGSQLQETRQGMVNFGTMAGVGQTSSSNNV